MKFLLYLLIFSSLCYAEVPALHLTGFIDSVGAEKKENIINHSSNILINAEDKEAFFTNGYLIVRKAFANTSEHMRLNCEKMIQEVLTELNKKTYPYQEGNQVAYLKGSQIVFQKENGRNISIQRIVGCGSYDDVFLQFLRSPELVDAFSFLLSSKKLEHLICQCHPKSPGDQVHFPRHKDITHRKNFDPDWQQIGEECSYAICIIAIDEMTPKNGGLFIEPLSNHGIAEPIPLYLNPGDALFMHPEIYHHSGPNESGKSRMTLLTGFCIFGANHANYPGNCTNDVLTLDARSSFETEAAPWKLNNDHSFKVK